MFPKDGEIATENENSQNDKNVTEALGHFENVANSSAEFYNNSNAEHNAKVYNIIVNQVKKHRVSNKKINQILFLFIHFFSCCKVL